MKNWQITVLSSTLIFVFFLICSPHFDYRFPFHIDEWHHIEQSIRLGNYGEYFEILKSGSFAGIEIGFHFLLFIISFGVNLALAFRVLPAIWGVFSALILFYVVYRKTDSNFTLAWLAVIFFASIKSNVNITGLWFFTPLTFAIPFIFLYFYLFTEGVKRQSKKMILGSFALMTFLLISHSISVLFAVPALLIFVAINFRYFLQEYKFFLWSLIVPVVGILFYKYTLAVPWPDLVPDILRNLQFKYGWGVLEIKNSLLELYSLIGVFLAVVGAVFIFLKPAVRKRYAMDLIWPITVFISIVIYRTTGVSYLSPYQRNLYYLALGLPILSAFGAYYLLTFFNNLFKKIAIRASWQFYLGKTLMLVMIAVMIFFTFRSYYNLPKRLELYRLIDESDYAALNFLARIPGTKVMALPEVSNALYPIAGKNPVGSIYFAGNRKKVEDFFMAPDCKAKRLVLNQTKAEYVLTKWKMNCGWELLYDKDNNYIYQYQSQKK